MGEVGPACRGEQLVRIEGKTAELDRERVVVDEGVLAPAWVARRTDRADAEPERVSEPAQPLKMYVSCGDRSRTGEERLDVFGPSLRQHDVLIGRRRRVAAEHASRLHGRLEAAEEVEPVRAELLLRPARRVEEALQLLGIVDGLGAEVEREHKLVGIAEHARAGELAQQLDALARLRPTLRDVT